MTHTSQSLLQQLNRHLFWVMVGMALTIFVIGNFVYWKANQAFAIEHQQLLQRHLNLQIPLIKKNWSPQLARSPHGELNRKQLIAWLSPLRYPDTKITLLHLHQPIFSFASDSPLPSQVNSWNGKHLITAEAPLDSDYRLQTTQYLTYPTSYIHFMTRPLLATLLISVILWLFLGRWAKRQNKSFMTLQQAITNYQQDHLNEAKHALKQLRTQETLPTELKVTVELFLLLMHQIHQRTSKIKKQAKTLELLNEITLELDGEGHILSHNHAWPPANLSPQVHDFNQAILDADLPKWQNYQQQLTQQKEPSPLQIRLKTKPQPSWYEARFSFHQENDQLKLLGVLRDIHEQFIQQQQIEFQALHDPLTHLPNRQLLYDRLGTAIAQAGRNKLQVGIMLLDLDHFKAVNDTLGHQAGDQVLQESIKRIQSRLRESDTLARWGGDEFVVVIPELEDCESLIPLVDSLIFRLSQPIRLDTETCQIGASIGVSCYPQHGQNIEQLIEYADQALYQAKERGRGQAVFYDAEALEIPNRTQSSE